MVYDNYNGTVLKIEGSYYKIKLENGTEVPNAQNTSSVDITVGDKVIISYADSLHNPIITSVYDKTAGISKDELKEVLSEIKKDIQQEILERDHPPGSPYFSFYVDDDPNDRFPNTVWVRIEENTYLVSAGPNLVGMTPVGSNTKTLTISNLPNHNHGGSISSVSLTTNSDSHTHTLGDSGSIISTSVSARILESGSTCGGISRTTSSNSHTHSINAHSHSLTINTNGSGESFDNRPKSLAIYMWRRIN